ncbi:DUF6783 domain-containing protein [uncultured Robinsoniella sp.]|uniref:DUF6783 domain-containing protein n=1 Tax=uncultured Robinsoniella sp. TaxID=904190 RepID=UPI00374F4E18
MKIHSCHLHAPLCGIFAPNSGYVARYAPFIRDKSPTKCDAQLPESNFKIRSRSCLKIQGFKTRSGIKNWIRRQKTCGSNFLKRDERVLI